MSPQLTERNHRNDIFRTMFRFRTGSDPSTPRLQAAASHASQAAEAADRRRQAAAAAAAVEAAAAVLELQQAMRGAEARRGMGQVQHGVSPQFNKIGTAAALCRIN